MRTIVVIGGAGGGAVAAARAREFDENARIVLVEKRAHMSFVQAGLRPYLEGRAARVDAIEGELGEGFAARHRVEVRTSTEAVRIDPDSQRLVLRTSTGTQETIRYDAAIFSGGASLESAGVDGLDGERVTGFRSAEDLAAIRAAIREGARRAVVLGAGPSGVDAAVALRAAGLAVDVIDRNDRVLPALSLLGARAAARALRELGVVLHLRNPVVRVTAMRDGGRLLRLQSGTEIAADLVVLATGLRPRTDILEHAGAALNADGSVRVSPQMETTLPHVFACGTAVSVTHAVTRRPLWVPQAAMASRTAHIAGHNAAVVGDAPREALSPMAGTALYEVGTRRFGRTGLSESEARTFLGDDRVLVVTTHGYAAEPWVGGEPLCVRLVVDKKAGVVVGGEVWGREGVPRRVDLLACAVVDGWAPSRVSDLDMAYAPTLGAAHDPLHIAGHIAAKALTGEANPISAEALALSHVRGGVTIIDVSRGDGASTMWPPGTRHIPLEDLRDRLAELPRTGAVVCVSQTGQRAWQAFRMLKQRGFSSVQHLDGGAMSFGLTLD